MKKLKIRVIRTKVNGKVGCFCKNTSVWHVLLAWQLLWHGQPCCDVTPPRGESSSEQNHFDAESECCSIDLLCILFILTCKILAIREWERITEHVLTCQIWKKSITLHSLYNATVHNNGFHLITSTKVSQDGFTISFITCVTIPS